MLDHSPDMTGDQFETIAAIARRQLLGAVPEQVARLHWDPPRLAQYRSTRLTETIRFAEHSPWHADRLSGLDLEAVTPDDLTSLPTMTKADVMDAWDRIVTDPRLSLVAARQHLAGVDDGGLPFLLGEYFVFTTGGSTGQPGVFIWSMEEFARWGASTIRFGIDAGDPPAECLTFVAARSLRHPSAWPPLLFHGWRAGTRQPVGCVVDAAGPRRCRGGRRAAHLATTHRRGGRCRRPARALDAAEPVFGTRPVENYATTDVGMVADQAPAEEAMIVHDDLMIVEPVDEDDSPVPPGELSHHVLVTSLHQRTMPMIRYRIDDRIRIASPADQRYGAFTRIASIEGRADDSFRYGDITVHPHTFRSILIRHALVDDYQIRQSPTVLRYSSRSVAYATLQHSPRSSPRRCWPQEFRTLTRGSRSSMKSPAHAWASASASFPFVAADKPTPAHSLKFQQLRTTS